MFLKKKKEQQATVKVDDRLQHIAFIMDGNGRWANKRGMPREFGHSHGAATFKRIARYCESIGLKYMTVYAFSTENWKRPQVEVNAIMKLLEQYIAKMRRRVDDDRVRYCFIGDLSVLSPAMQKKIHDLEEASAGYTQVLNIALNYGGREEIVHCCNELMAQGKTHITEEDIERHLYTAHCPPPDLIVRTGGELRLSNFLMWQSAYAEFYFTDVLWPDFGEADVDAAISAFYTRGRRFGGVVSGS